MVNARTSQIHCCGTLEGVQNYGARCSKQINKDELARALLGLQTLALDRKVAGENLKKALAMLADDFLCKAVCRTQEQMKKLAEEMERAIVQWRKDDDGEQVVHGGTKVAIGETVYDEIVHQQSEANQKLIDLTRQLNELKIEIASAKFGFVTDSDGNVHNLARHLYNSISEKSDSKISTRMGSGVVLENTPIEENHPTTAELLPTRIKLRPAATSSEEETLTTPCCSTATTPQPVGTESPKLATSNGSPGYGSSVSVINPSATSHPSNLLGSNKKLKDPFDLTALVRKEEIRGGCDDLQNASTQATALKHGAATETRRLSLVTPLCFAVSIYVLCALVIISRSLSNTHRSLAQLEETLGSFGTL